MNRLRQTMWPSSQTRRATLVTAMVLLGVAVVFAALSLRFDAKAPANTKDLAATFQATVTVVAIVVGGVFALFKLQAFRDFSPHLAVLHHVHHRRISPNYVHVDVVTELRNTSRVKIGLRSAEISLQLLGPLTDQDVATLTEMSIRSQQSGYVEWPTLDQTEIEWSKGEFVVEPGETHRQTFEFVLEVTDAEEVRTIGIYTYFFNPGRIRDAGAAEGWGTYTVYDIFRVDQ